MNQISRQLGTTFNLGKKVCNMTQSDFYELLSQIETHGVIRIPNQDLCGDECLEFMNFFGGPLLFPEYNSPTEREDYEE